MNGNLISYAHAIEEPGEVKTNFDAPQQVFDSIKDNTSLRSSTDCLHEATVIRTEATRVVRSF